MRIKSLYQQEQTPFFTRVFFLFSPISHRRSIFTDFTCFATKYERRWVLVKGQMKWEWKWAGFVAICSEWPVKASKERCMANVSPRCDISRQASPGALYWAAEPSDPSASAVYWQLLTAAWRICALKANGRRRSDTREASTAAAGPELIGVKIRRTLPLISLR